MPRPDDGAVARARFVLRPPQGPQAPHPSGRPDRAICCRVLRSTSAAPSPPISPTCSIRRLDDVRLEIGFGGGEHLIAEARAFPDTRLHRLRALCQRHGEDPDADRGPQHRQHPAVRRRRRRIAGLGAAAFAGADRSDPSRSVAEAAALEAALRAGRDRRRDGARAQAGRRISLRQRHRRLLRLDAGASAALAGFRLDRGARLRLAPALGRLHHDALRPQSRARRAARRRICGFAKWAERDRHAGLVAGITFTFLERRRGWPGRARHDGD